MGFLEAGGQSIVGVLFSKITTMVPAALFLLLTGALAKPPPMDDGLDDGNFTMDGIILERSDLEEDRAINTCDCAPVTASSRIVGGKEVNPKYRLPYQAFVYPSVPGVGSFMCGGTIVNKRYVITAAHCTDYRGSTITDVRVAIGEHSICDGVTNEGGSWISAKRVVNHPNYGNHDNDIAVLELSEDITFTANIKPACLPTSATKEARWSWWQTILPLATTVASMLTMFLHPSKGATFNTSVDIRWNWHKLECFQDFS